MPARGRMQFCGVAAAQKGPLMFTFPSAQAIVPTDVTTGSMQYPVQLPLPPLALKATCICLAAWLCFTHCTPDLQD